jgi:hypothetical protein
MRQILNQLAEAARWIREAGSRISIRADAAPIDTVERVEHFAATRAALIAQKKLYGYLKERMGVRYPTVFQDEIFAQSIDVAKLEVFAACLADLTCFCVAAATATPTFDNAGREAMARACFRHGVAFNGETASEAQRERWIESFEARLGRTVWTGGEGGRHFTESPAALIRWAPIADELKRLDREIVENSLRYAWIEIRTDYMARIDPAAIAAGRSAAAG